MLTLYVQQHDVLSAVWAHKVIIVCAENSRLKCYQKLPYLMAVCAIIVYIRIWKGFMLGRSRGSGSSNLLLSRC